MLKSIDITTRRFCCSVDKVLSKYDNNLGRTHVLPVSLIARSVILYRRLHDILGYVAVTVHS